MIITTVEQLSKINNILSCTICKEIFRAPVITSTCHHVFCSACIRKSLNQGLQYCPVCHTELFESYLNKCTIIEDMSLWFSNWILYNKDQNQKQILMNQNQVAIENENNNDIADENKNSSDQGEIKQDRKSSSSFHNDLETNSNTGGYYYISRKLTDPKRPTNSSKSSIEPNKTITNLLRTKKSRLSTTNSDTKSPPETISEAKRSHSEMKNDENIEVIDLDRDNLDSQVESDSKHEISMISEINSSIENEIIEVSSQEQMNYDALKLRKRRRLAGFIKTNTESLHESKTNAKECQDITFKTSVNSYSETNDSNSEKENEEDIKNEEDLKNSGEKVKAEDDTIFEQKKIPECIDVIPDGESSSLEIKEEIQSQSLPSSNSEKNIHNTKDAADDVDMVKSVHNQLMEENNVLSGINVVKIDENKANQRSAINKQSRIPKLDLSKLNISKVKEKFRQHKIPLPSKYPDFSKSKSNSMAKEHKYLQNYFNQYYILWNSNLDTDFPLSKAEIMAQVKEWERFQILQEHNNAMKRDFSEIKKVESSAWILKYKNEFQELIVRAKSSKANPVKMQDN